MKYCLFFFLLSINTFAQTQLELMENARKADYKIDWKYNAGMYFIYDCERMHYACVNSEGNTNCQEERNFAIEKKAPMYPCAPLSKFADKISCVEKSYKIVDINAPRRFCYPK